MSDRKSISNYVRFQVFKRDRFTCQYCGKSGVELEVDHIKPVADGGTNDIGNLITSCKDCNRAKSSMTVLPDGYKLVKEPKTRRVQLLVRPTVFSEFKKIAEANNKSVNDFLNDIMEEVVKAG